MWTILTALRPCRTRKNHMMPGPWSAPPGRLATIRRSRRFSSYYMPAAFVLISPGTGGPPFSPLENKQLPACKVHEHIGQHKSDESRPCRPAEPGGDQV